MANSSTIFHVPINLFKETFGHFAIGMYESSWQLSNTAFVPVPETEKTLVTKLRNPGH